MLSATSPRVISEPTETIAATTLGGTVRGRRAHGQGAARADPVYHPNPAVTTADRIGYLLGALGALAVAVLVRPLGAAFVLSGPWLPAMCLGLGAVSLALALRPASWEGAETVGLALLAGMRLAIPLALTLGWMADGREVWVAVAMLVALQDAGQTTVRRWPMAPAAIGSAVVIAWSAMEPRVAPARAVFVALVCASASAWGAARVRAPDADR